MNIKAGEAKLTEEPHEGTTVVDPKTGITRTRFLNQWYSRDYAYSYSWGDVIRQFPDVQIVSEA